MVAHGLPVPSCVNVSVEAVQGSMTLRAFFVCVIVVAVVAGVAGVAGVADGVVEAARSHAIALSTVPSAIFVCPVTGVLSKTCEKRSTASVPHRFDVVV